MISAIVTMKKIITTTMSRFYVVKFTKEILVETSSKKPFKELPYHKQQEIIEDAISEIMCYDAPVSTSDADWDNVENIEADDDE